MTPQGFGFRGSGFQSSSSRMERETLESGTLEPLIFTIFQKPAFAAPG